MITRLFTITILLCTFFYSNGQVNPRVIHYSTGEVQTIIISGHANSICQLLDLVIKLSNSGKDSLEIIIPYPKKTEDFIDKKCLGWIIPSTIIKKKSEELNFKGKESNYSKDSFFIDQINSALKKKVYVKRILINYLEEKSRGKAHITWIPDINYRQLNFVQDAFIPFQDQKMTYLFTSSKNMQLLGRSGELASRIGGSLNIEFKESSPINFDGGNMLLTPKLAIIGKGIIANNTEIEDFSIKLKELVQADSILFIGTDSCVKNKLNTGKSKCSVQPHYHLDLFLNVLEKPDSFIFIFAKAREDLDTILPCQACIFNNKVNTIVKNLPEKILGKTLVIDYIPIHIKNEGNVWKTYSFNNCLLEFDPFTPSESFAYIPFYQRIDDSLMIQYKEEINKTFKKHGVENIIYIQSKHYGFDKSVASRASMHCLLKVLRRATPDIVSE